MVIGLEMKIRHLVRVCLYSLAVLFSAHSAWAEQEIVIGMMTELSGPAVGVGTDCRSGYELARRRFAPRDQVSRHKLRFVLADHKSDPKTGISEFNRLADSEAAWVVLSNRNPVVLALSPISVRKRVPILVVTGHPVLREQNPYAFEFWPTVGEEGALLAKFLIASEKRTLAMLSTVDDWTLGLRDALAESFEKSGGKIVFDQEVSKEETDFGTYALRLRADASEAIFVNLRPGQVGSAVRRLHEAGVDKQLLGNIYMPKPEEVATAGMEAIEGAVFAQLNYARPNFLFAAKSELGAENLGAVSYSCYSAMAALLQALHRTAEIRGPEDVTRALAGLESIELPDERVLMRDREAKYPLSLARMRGGKPELFKIK